MTVTTTVIISTTVTARVKETEADTVTVQKNSISKRKIDNLRNS